MRTLSCIVCLLHLVWIQTDAAVLRVGKGQAYARIASALSLARAGDTILIMPGTYREGNLQVRKRVTLLGQGLPVLDGELKYEILSIRADSTRVEGLKLIRCGHGSLDDPAALKVYNRSHVVIANNVFDNNFFAIYIQYGRHALIRENRITAYGEDEQLIGNGIHCWKSDSLQIIGNRISGHRDGIYFEFVKHSVIWRNISTGNVRYGLHFMFSDDDAYITNVFRQNGSGVAVMYSKQVKMYHNQFDRNWGDASYGLLLKDITDSYIEGNRFENNTSGIYMEGANRISIRRNVFSGNGWGLKIQASCMDNQVEGNNFLGNTFDVATNGSLVLNRFQGNYWDDYRGYDLNKDQVGDVPYHPLSLFSMIVENNNITMLLFRSFLVALMDQSERILPSLTPQQFEDSAPLMKALPL